EFQALFGMADDLKRALIDGGYRVREYCAIGELLPGMAYLVRRLLENTSNEGFVGQRSLGEAGRDQLLANPTRLIDSGHAKPDTTDVRRGHRFVPRAPDKSFTNAPNSDFTKALKRDRQRDALERLASSPARRWPLVVGGKRVTDAGTVESVNPARPAQIVGHWSRATITDADAALAAARAAFPKWRATPVDERAQFLERAADLMEERRFELNALEILEAGKPWLDADADVSEAIDFCRFYAIEMRRLDRPTTTQRVPGERCVQRWTPRGTGVVIAPWNFPLAILCGMTAASVVAGNTVIMKPAEQTSLLGGALMEIFIAAGIPPGVINLLTGFGEDVGAHLVAHPHVDFVAFTGSRSVGLRIREAAGRTPSGSINLKKVVCEMGGKNALIIDTDADLDEAIPAALYSAFGFSGQKCSALSRLIVLDDIHDEFVGRLIDAAAAMPIGDPMQPGTMIGPVIDRDAQQRILHFIEQGKREAGLAWQAMLPPEVLSSSGYFVPPTIFTAVKPDAVIAREEIFGPVLAVMKVRDLDRAFEVANASEYALTGGLFSRSPQALERAGREFLVGNLYLNRGITGAMVERHPFGGFKMSGSGTKAGGKGYLENFVFPRAIAENVLRRGFTPPEQEEGSRSGI
ncbi:MAG: proline dehydrogenase family protein, partial [Opitutaceae bacterium]